MLRPLAMIGWCLVAAVAASLALLVTEPAPRPLPTVDPVDLQFCGQTAYERMAEFVLAHPDRASGRPNNLLAAEFLAQRLSELGYQVSFQRFTALLYGKETELGNVIAVRPGASPETIAVVSHIDQATTTVYGADNDGSGVGISWHLAELMAEPGQRTLLFLFTDGEEYGMLGAREFARSHPLAGDVILALSLDNVGREGAHGIHMAPIGQGRGYTDLGTAAVVQAVARRIGGWVPSFPSPLFQVLERALLISFTDQGPLLTQGIPAVGFGVDTESWPHYHGPTDTIEHQSPETLGQVGRLSEALIREYDAGGRPEAGPQPYVLRTDDRYVPPRALRPALFLLLLPIIAAVTSVRREGGRITAAAVRRLGLLSVPGLVGWLAIRMVGTTDLWPRFEFYPATPLDPVLYQPGWLGLVIVAAAVMVSAAAASRLLRRVPTPDPLSVRMVGLGLLLLLALGSFLRNEFIIIMFVPAAWLWPMISGGRFRRWSLLVLGGILIYALLGFYGMMIQLGPYMLYYLVLMLGTGMIAPYTAITALLALGAGLSLATAPDPGA